MITRLSFAIWGLMSEIIGETLVVTIMTVTAVAAAAAGLALAI